MKLQRAVRLKRKNEIYSFVFRKIVQKIHKSAFSGEVQVLPELFGVFCTGIQKARFFQGTAFERVEAPAVQSVEQWRR